MEVEVEELFPKSFETELTRPLRPVVLEDPEEPVEVPKISDKKLLKPLDDELVETFDGLFVSVPELPPVPVNAL